MLQLDIKKSSYFYFLYYGLGFCVLKDWMNTWNVWSIHSTRWCFHCFEAGKVSTRLGVWRYLHILQRIHHLTPHKKWQSAKVQIAIFVFFKSGWANNAVGGEKQEYLHNQSKGPFAYVCSYDVTQSDICSIVWWRLPLILQLDK